MKNSNNIVEYKKVNKKKKKSTNSTNNTNKINHAKQNHLNTSSKKNSKNNKINKVNKIDKRNKVSGELDLNYIPNYEKEIRDKKVIKNKKHNKRNNVKHNVSDKVSSNGALFIAMAVAIIVGISIYFVIYSSYFTLTNITVNSNNKVSTEEILKKININLNSNTILAYFNIDKQSILELPYVEDVKVIIESNNSIKIDIKERESYYLANNTLNNKYYKLDKNGYIIEEIESINYKHSEILLYGLKFDENLNVGNNINENEKQKIIKSKYIEDIIVKSIADTKITKITVNNHLYKFKINDKLEVIFNSLDNIEYNINFLKAMLPEIGIADGSIDFTVSNPIFIRNS